MKTTYTSIPVVIATPEDVEEAIDYGLIRQEESKGLKDAHGLVNDDETTDLERQTIGILGEMAVASYFQIPYVFTVNTFKAPDIYTPKKLGLQVKASERTKSLIFRPDAKDNEPYIKAFVTVHNPYNLYGATIKLNGWMTPYDARLLADVDERLWDDPPERTDKGIVQRKAPAIFIPDRMLRPMIELRDQ